MSTAVDYAKLDPQPIHGSSRRRAALITSSLSASLFLKKCFKKTEVEEFWAVALNSAKQVIKAEMLFRGTVDSCLIHPRDVFRFACLNNASALIIAHNHPSNDCQPSDHDLSVTKRLVKAGQLLQVPIIDHIIVTDHDYYSFRDNGRI